MNDVVIRPLRFTDQVAEMRAFLETLGLQARIESARSSDWVDMLAGRGMVALHSAASSSTGGKPGQTDLSFEAEDVDRLKEKFEQAGYADAVIWDEAYGRVLRVAGPDGVHIHIDERSDDLYGYKLNETRPDERWLVTPQLDRTEESAWRGFLEVVGLDALARFGDGVRLELTTSEDLAAVHSRLAAAGYQAVQVADTIEITDPDGQTVVVHG
ncbi:VOC family protein [Kribbella sp. NPDC056345]|uniref:VOC family protein n=1 Tax=Kribbella sp. NPDC056345 TaxID=3345789 RepID=UPI0035DE2CC7